MASQNPLVQAVRKANRGRELNPDLAYGEDCPNILYEAAILYNAICQAVDNYLEDEKQEKEKAKRRKAEQEQRTSAANARVRNNTKR